MHKARMAGRLLAGIGSGLMVLGTLGCVTPGEGQGQEASAVSERHVAITMPDGTADALLFVPGGGRTPAPAVLLWTDIVGLRPAFADVGRKLAAEGYVVLVPNAFYRSAKIDGSTSPGVLGQEELRLRNTEWRAAMSDDAAARDAKAYVGFLDTLAEVKKSSKIGMVGYDIGAAYAFLGAQAVPGRVGAVAAYHPTGVATTRPNSPHLTVNRSKAAYYVALAAPDDAREPEDKDDLRKAFAAAGLAGTVAVLPGGHGFMTADNPLYDAASAQPAWAATLDLFGSALR